MADEPLFDLKREEEAITSAHEYEEEDVARILSEKYGLTYTDLSLVQVDTEALRIVAKESAQKAEAVPFDRVAKHVSLAVNNPGNPELKKLVKDLEQKGFVVEKFLVSRRSLEKALGRYSELSFASVSSPGLFTLEASLIQKPPETLAELNEMLSVAIADTSLEHISRMLEVIFIGAFSLGASDLHFESDEGGVRLRFRLDGILTDVSSFKDKVWHQINSRLKLLSGVKLNVTNRAQDGRFSINKGGIEIEVRASFIPGSFGESVVLRLLDPASIQVSLSELGMNSKLLARLETEIHRSNGLLLTTGPTGSGKTTTLYSFLREIHSPDIKIITIEDPIEYHLDGIVQTQVESEKYTFSSGLRSIVRQDPDVIMVGEIRDAETAEIAIQASLTGHFVFSTLHTNNAAGTFPRLVDLGVDPKTFGSSITVSMAQRLVRRLDPEHMRERPATEKELAVIGRVLDSVVDKSLIPENTKTVWEPVPKSDDITGYHGRIGLYEAIFMDDALADLLRQNPTQHDISVVAAKQGFLTMAQDGVIKALNGVTTIEEVGRLVELP